MHLINRAATIPGGAAYYNLDLLPHPCRIQRADNLQHLRHGGGQQADNAATSGWQSAVA